MAAIVSLPRFTFKSSGADVSASVLYLEKRKTPLENIADSEEYQFAVELIEKVGWDAGNKKLHQFTRETRRWQPHHR